MNHTAIVRLICVFLLLFLPTACAEGDGDVAERFAEAAHGSGTNIAIPGYETLSFKAGSRTQTVNITNPPENACAFVLSLALDDGEVLWTGEALSPGEAFTRITLKQALDAGEYPATLHYDCYSLQNNTPLNGAEISKATVTVTAKDQSIMVGGTVPDLSSPVLDTHYSVSGLVGEDTLTTAPALAYQKDGSAATPDNTTAGTYDIVPSGASAGDNYNISYTNGTLTITDKNTQTITAENVTATYGDTDKKVSATTDGDGAISYAVKDGSADYIEVASDGKLTIKAVPADGKAYVVVTAAETSTYAQATKEVTVTINKANAAPATVTANNRTYDGTEKPLVTVDDSTLVGGEMRYALGTDANTAPADNLYTTSIPTATDAGT